MLRRLGQVLDDALLVTLLIATVAHIAGFMQVYEEPWLWWAAWLQAAGIDLAILRASYLYKTYGAGHARTVALTAVIFFSACSAVLNMAYYVRAGAHIVVAVPMAIFFPVAITILSYLRGVRDVQDERRDRRLAGRLAGQDAGQGQAPVMLGRDTGRGHMPARDDRQVQREQVVRLRRQGLSMRQISAETGVPRSTAGAWLRSAAAEAEGKEADHDRTG